MDFFFVQFRDMNYFQNLPRIMDYSDHPPPPPPQHLAAFNCLLFLLCQTQNQNEQPTELKKKKRKADEGKCTGQE